MGESRTHNTRISAFFDLIDYDRSIRDMIKSQVKIEFFTDPDRCKDIVATVRMTLERHFLFKNWNHRFKLHIKWNIFSILFFFHILFCLEQQIS